MGCAGVGECFASYGCGAAKFSGCSLRHGKLVGPAHNVGIQDGKEPLDIACAQGTEECLNCLTLL